MRLNIFLSLNLWLLSSIALAQMEIKGRLLEKGTKKPLSETNVFILPHKLKVETNSEGQFTFSNVPEGEFTFVINKSGYLRMDFPSEKGINNYELYLEKEFYDVFETVVVGKEIKNDVSKKTLTQKEFLKAPGAQEDPVRAVQNLPGVANQAFSAQIVIQGSEPDDTRYSINGHEIPLIFHFAGLTSVVTPTAVDEVEFLAAGYGPEYGRALGGIINLKTQKPKTERWFGEGFIDITKLGALTQGPINEKSSLLLSARISYFGQIFERVAEDMDDFSVTTAPEFQDMYLNYNYKLSEKEEFSFLAINSRDELSLILKEGDDPNIEGNLSNVTTFFRLIPRYTKKLSETSLLDVSVAYGGDNLNFNIGDRFFDLKSEVITHRTDLSFQSSPKLSHNLGLDLQWRKFNLDIQVPRGNEGGGVNSTRSQNTFAVINGDSSELALYLRNTYKANQKLTLVPNLRWEYFSSTEQAYFMPRLNTSYTLSDSLMLNLAAGLYYQGPQNGENSDEFGNPKVKAEKSTHFFTSLAKDFRKGSRDGLKMELGVFYKVLDDLIVSTSEQLGDGTAKVNDNDGEGTVEGIQLQASYKFKELQVVTSYTYLKSRRRDPDNGTYPSEFDQTHNLNLIAAYDLARWSFSSRLRFVTGGPYTPIVGGIFDSDNDVYAPIRGAFYSDRFDDFFQLDFRVDRKFIYRTWILSGYLDIQNLTNSKNGQGLSYNYDFSESQNTTGFPFLPILGLRGEF
jgi:hypothetical protein